MTPSAALAAVHELPVEDQLDHVFRVWDGILDAGWTAAPSTELLAELERRLAAHDADPTRALTWDQITSHVRRLP